jgi:TrmH family RNA methyltransferase
MLPTPQVQRISSRRNPLVNQYRDVARGKNPSLLLLDGAHLVSAALAANLHVRHIVVAAEALDRPEVRAIVDRIDPRWTTISAASAPVISAMSPVRQSSGIVAIAERPSRGDAELFPSVTPLVVIAADVQDPGNIGAITRVAEAGGASSVIAAGASADPFGWKALRGSMGSALRLPIAVERNAYLAVDRARKHGCQIVAATPAGGVSLFELRLGGGAMAILVGGEGAGLAADLLAAADVRVSIPMKHPVESLNTAVAAGLLIYESCRQRRWGSTAGR